MISSLVLRNYGPFRGEHRLELAPTIYAVVARAEDDPDASNMAGKSWLLSAVRFALFGSHPGDREDDLVTRGEREGGVVLTLSDGLSVGRSRELGKSTQLAVGDARGRDAQQLVERRVGLCEADFLAASFFRQKAMARFVDARPSERSAEVSAWLRLGPLQRAHGRAAALAAEAGRLEQAAACRVEALEQARARLAADTWSELAVVDLELRAEEAAGAARQKAEELAEMGKVCGWAEIIHHREQLRAEVAELEALGDEEPDLTPLRVRAEEADHALRAASEDVRRKRVLSAGMFSGVCPVNARACPVRAEINEDLGTSLSLLHAANQVLACAMADQLGARDALEGAQGAVAAHQARRTRIRALRDQLARVDASAPPLSPGAAVPAEGDVQQLRQRLRMLQEVERAAVLDLERARRREVEVAQLSAQLERAREDHLALAAQLRTRREAVAVLGRGGVQRRVAEGALREVEADACGLLAEAGIDLAVSLVWDRPTDQPAAVCDACDGAFPPSRRVKACARCGAPRGPKLAEGLDVELSKVSGFAEDAAGIAMSLAASAWLRRERDVQWPVLCADEPFSAADAKNRRALLNLFRIAGGRCGVSQMLLVAHSDALMDGLPGRIQVVAGPDGSRVEVVG